MKIFIQELYEGLDAIDFNMKLLGPSVTSLYNNVTYTLYNYTTMQVCHDLMWEKNFLIQFSLELTFALTQFQNFNLFVTSCVKFSMDISKHKNFNLN